MQGSQKAGCGRRRSAWVVAGAVGLVIAAVAAIWLVRMVRQRPIARVEAYAGIRLGRDSTVVEEVDRFSGSFLDGEYYAIVQLTRESMDQTLASRPPWASGGWQAGRQANLAKQLDIGDQHVQSVIGVDNGVFKILTVDTQGGRLYFEMKEY